MNKKNFILIFLSSLILFMVTIFYGYNIYNSKPPLDKLVEDEGDKSISMEEDIISPNTIIEGEVFYSQCKHTLMKSWNTSEDIVNMTKEEFIEFLEENYPDIKLVSFSIDLIKLKEERSTLCSNHYIVGEYNGFVAIYGIDQNGERIVDKVFTDNPISILKPIDQEKLIQGILVDTDEELSDVLENFIS